MVGYTTKLKLVDIVTNARDLVERCGKVKVFCTNSIYFYFIKIIICASFSLKLCVDVFKLK